MSNPNDNKRAMVVQPGEGEAVWFLHGRMTVKATAEGTNGAFGLTEVVIPPGFSAADARPPPRGRVVLRPRGRADRAMR
jgi:hypothetical protein